MNKLCLIISVVAIVLATATTVQNRVLSEHIEQSWTSRVPTPTKQQPEGLRDDNVNPPELPQSYSAQVVQVGGIGSDLVSKTVFSLDDNGFIDKDTYIYTSFNRSRDLMWVNCTNGYKAQDGNSKTSNTFLYDTALGYGVELKEQYKNSFDITCIK